MMENGDLVEECALGSGRDTGECWLRGTQILGAACEGRWVVLASVCNLEKSNKSYIYTNNGRVLP